MPFWNEESPSSRHQIEFKSLEDLIYDTEYFIYHFPSLEQPRQLSLSEHEFDTINRDYCIVQSPGKISWQQPESQENPELKIFHSDSVRVPKWKALENFKSSEYSVGTYSTRWYLQGMTRVNVEKLFKCHFNLAIPLSKESSSAHWIPCPILYNVEVGEDVWENRVALFFDGNVETSMQSMTNRIGKYGHAMQTSKLGEYYLSAWRTRWDPKDALFEPPVSTDSTATFLVPEIGQSDMTEKDPPPTNPKPRGRKRTAALRQLRSAPNGLPITSPGNSLPDGPELPKPANYVSRGRLKRRERRKKRGREDPPNLEAKSSEAAVKSNFLENYAPNIQPDDNGHCWRYDSKEPGLKGSWREAPRQPAIAVIEFGNASSMASKQSFDRPKGTTDEMAMSSGKGLPQIMIQSSIALGTSDQPEIKCFHVMYDGTLTSSSNFTENPESTTTHDKGAVTLADAHPDMLPTEDGPVHVADLIDEVGFITTDSYEPKLFISAIVSDPFAAKPSLQLGLTDQEHSISSSSPLSRTEYEDYWQKFLILICGYVYPSDLREAPYSLGYGLNHSNPPLVRRSNRWGYYDVDNVCDKPGRPRWRAALKFEFHGDGLQSCTCTWMKGIPHDLNTCRHLIKETIDPRAYYYSGRNVPDKVLSDALYFVHSPFEVLQSLPDQLHLYWPPYVSPKEEKKDEGNETNDEPKNEAEESQNSESLGEYSERALQDSPMKVHASGKEPIDIPDELVEINEEGDDGELNIKSPTSPDDEASIDRTIAEDKSSTEEPPVVSRQLQRNEEVEFEIGICYLMGLGVPKDVQKGFESIMDSATMGCLRGKALLSRLSSAYNGQLEIPHNIHESWLLEASKFGSKIALAELERLFPKSFKEIQALNRFVFDFKHPDVFDYSTDVLKHFDLGDPALLSEQLKHFAIPKPQGNVGSDSNPSIAFSSVKTLNVVAKIPNENHYDKKEKYYNFGSLLHLAALFGFEESISILLDAGFDVNGHNSNPAFRTPLLCALGRGYSSIAKLLIKRGADCQATMLWSEDDTCLTPSPLHYLINIENPVEAVDLARLIVKGGADVNYKCSVKLLQNDLDIPVLTGKSVTPLRWAVIHEKVHLVKVLLNLGAKFAYETYIRNPSGEKSVAVQEQKGCLLLETPCTNIDILEMFFARARVPGLPIEFSQTPLGLLVSEDDAPEQRLRPGFDDQDKIIDAVRLLLELQPGHEEVFLWSAVRHDQEIVRYLLDDLGWDVESRWKGLTCLQTAVLYGHKDMVEYLLSMGADAAAKTESRHLTCFHLLALVPRHPQIDLEILELLKQASNIDVNGKEKIDSLTALHFAVRNQKFKVTKELLTMGADCSAPASDQLDILSQGRGRYLEKVPDRPAVFTSSLKILGEVVIRYIQDGFYSSEYVADLIVFFLDSKDIMITEEDLIIDKGNGMSLLHLLAVIPHRDNQRSLSRKEWHAIDHWNPPKPPPKPTEAEISLLQLVLLRTSKDLINLQDSRHGDTALHYACAARQVHNIKALLSFGADPHLKNRIGLTAVEILAWSVMFLGGKTMGFSYQFGQPQWGNVKEYNYMGDLVERAPTKSPSEDLKQAFALFKEHGLIVDERLYYLALAWACAAPIKDRNGQVQDRGKSSSQRFVLVPEESGKVDSKVAPKEESHTPDTFGRHIGDRKTYYYLSLEGPDRASKEGYRDESYAEAQKATQEREAL